jgi:hypothetical protein
MRTRSRTSARPEPPVCVSGFYQACLTALGKLRLTQAVMYQPASRPGPQRGRRPRSSSPWRWFWPGYASGGSAGSCLGEWLFTGARRSRYGLVVLSRWRGALAAVVVTLVACVLVILDLTDAGLRHWWDGHTLTIDSVAGLLVLLVTVLVVDQVLRLRQINNRARVVAVQAAIMVTQASRASQAVSQVLAGSGDRDVAGDEFRTYTLMCWPPRRR